MEPGTFYPTGSHDFILRKIPSAKENCLELKIHPWASGLTVLCTPCGPLVADHTAAKSCSLRAVLTVGRQGFHDLRILSNPESSWLLQSELFSHILDLLQFCGTDQILLSKSRYGNLAEKRGGCCAVRLLTDTWIKFEPQDILTSKFRILEFEDHIFHFGKKCPWDFDRDCFGYVDYLGVVLTSSLDC